MEFMVGPPAKFMKDKAVAVRDCPALSHSIMALVFPKADDSHPSHARVQAKVAVSI